jgi:ABC-type glycerol-3-phosphate transport system substrate-binding protein
MKKYSIIISIVVFGLVLVACGGTTTTAAPTTAAPTTAAPQLLENAEKDYYLTVTGTVGIQKKTL